MIAAEVFWVISSVEQVFFFKVIDDCHFFNNF